MKITTMKMIFIKRIPKMDARIKNGIKVDNADLEKSLKGNKILHNFIDIVQESEPK